MPRWVIPATVIFWAGALAALVVRAVWARLDDLVVLLAISLFLSLAIEPGVNRLSRRGWRRGSATALILFGVVIIFLLFVAAIGTLVGSQIAELLTNTERYISRTVNFLNDTFGFNINAQEAIDAFNDPDGAVQQFIEDQQDDALALSVTALGWLLQLFSVILFTFYLVADGPRLRRSICSRLTPDHQERVLQTWELASTKTGGYLYSRALLALLSTLFHWIVFQSVGTAAPIALALWVGIVSQFLPVVGTYIAGVLPVVITFLDSPLKALIVLIAIVVYQQIENYVFAPRITARTMQLHPALAFGSALAGAALLGAVGAVLALPAAAMAQALVSELGTRHIGRRQPSDHRRRGTPPTPARLLVRVRRRPGPGAPRLEAALMLPSAVVPDRRDHEERCRRVDPLRRRRRPRCRRRAHVVGRRSRHRRVSPLGAQAACRRRPWSTPASPPTPTNLLSPRRATAASRSTSRSSGESWPRRASTRTPSATPRHSRCRRPSPRTCCAPAGGASALLQNCSGKHAAMLSTSVANGWEVDGYLEFEHPVQKVIDAYIAEAAGGVSHTGDRRMRCADGDGHAARPGARRAVAGDQPVSRLRGDASSFRNSSPAPGGRTPC